MRIEFEFNSVMVQDMQEKFPNLISKIQSYLPTKKTPKRKRKRKNRKLVSCLIDEIIDSIDTK